MRELHLRWWAAGTVAALAVSLLVQGAYGLSLVTLVAISVLRATSLRFVMIIGEVPFAQAAFFGLGAYGAGIVTTLLEWPFAVALLLGPVAVIVLSILFGLVTLRIKGPHFMLIGFAFTEAVRIALGKVNAIGGVSGMGGIFPPSYLDNWLPSFVVAVVVLLVFGLYALEKSELVLALVEILDNEDLAMAVGLNTLWLKVACFTVASACAAVGGSLHAFVNNVISPPDFSFLLAVYALAFVKIGGESSMLGTIVGAVLLTLIGSFALGLGAAEHYVYGGAIVLAMLLLPQGLAGLPWRRWFGGSTARRRAQPSRSKAS